MCKSNGKYLFIIFWSEWIWRQRSLTNISVGCILSFRFEYLNRFLRADQSAISIYFEANAKRKVERRPINVSLFGFICITSGGFMCLKFRPLTEHFFF